jgi:hypothetical protein
VQKNLIIFENTDEVETFITQRSFDELKSERVNIIAIQPDAQAYLKRKNIFFFNTTRFFSKESHQNILLKSAEVIEPFRRLLNIKDCFGIEEGYSNSFIFCLRHYSILYLLWLTEIVHNAIEQLKPEKIVTMKYKYPPKALNTILREERILCVIVGQLAAQNRVQVQLFEGREKRLGSYIEKGKESLLEVLKKFAFQINLLLFRYKRKGRKVVLYSSKSYSLEKVIGSFLKISDNFISILLNSNNVKDDVKNTLSLNRYRNMLVLLPVFSPGKIRRVFSRELNNSINRLSDFFSNNRQILRYKGVDLQGLVFSKIKNEIIPLMINLYGQTYNLDKLLRSIKPDLILSQMSRGIFYNLGELSKIHNITSVLISHGSHVPASNRYADMEWGEHGLGLMNTHYKYLAIQSPWAMSYLRNRPSSSIPIITGPLLFTRIRKDKDIRSSTKRKLIPQHYDKIIILHAGTPKFSKGIRPYVYETVDEYIENINSLIRAVEKLKEVHLIVRFRPSDYLKLSDFQELLVKSNCYNVHSKGTFEDYLTIADLLVSYSSTTVEEALQNRVPVLQYDGHGKYCHIKGQILDPSLKPGLDSCYYVGSEKKLLWAIRWLLENHFTKDIPDNVWNRHVFDDSEKVELSSHFSELFLDDK